KQWSILDHAFAHQGAVPGLSHLTFESSLIASHAKLIDESRHDAFQERILRRGLCFIRVARRQTLLSRHLHDLAERLLDLPGRLRMNAVTSAPLCAEPILLRELIGPHQCMEIRRRAALE